MVTWKHRTLYSNLQSDLFSRRFNAQAHTNTVLIESKAPCKNELSEKMTATKQKKKQQKLNNNKMFGSNLILHFPN